MRLGRVLRFCRGAFSAPLRRCFSGYHPSSKLFLRLAIGLKPHFWVAIPTWDLRLGLRYVNGPTFEPTKGSFLSRSIKTLWPGCCHVSSQSVRVGGPGLQNAFTKSRDSLATLQHSEGFTPAVALLANLTGSSIFAFYRDLIPAQSGPSDIVSGLPRVSGRPVFTDSLSPLPLVFGRVIKWLRPLLVVGWLR